MQGNSDGGALSHWYTLFEDFSTSTQDFYEAVEEAIERRKIPDVEISRVLYHEGGMWTAKREYLRVKRGQVVCDICSAPYGTSHFFSWWVTKAPIRFGLPLLMTITTLLCYLLWKFLQSHLSSAIPEDSFLFYVYPLLRWILLSLVFLFAPPILFFLFGLAVQEGIIGDEEWLLSTPVVGPLYAKIFKPASYYRIDTAYMFRDSMQAIVGEVVNGLREEKGLRLLEEEELAPSVPEEMAG